MPRAAGAPTQSPSPPRQQPPQDGKLPAKKMSPDELQQSLQRLTTVKPRKQETEPLNKPVILPKGTLVTCVNRLYSEGVEHKKRVMESLEKKAAPLQERHMLDAEHMTSSVERVYSQAVQHRKDMAQKLKSKHAPDAAPAKKLTKEDQEACNDRTYRAPMQKKKETEVKLASKYLDSTVTKFKKMNKAEWNETVSRLTTGK